MEMERGEEGGRRDREREREKDTRERIIYHSRLPNNTKERKYNMYTYTHIIQVCTEIQIYQRYPPSYLLLSPRLYQSFQYKHHNTLLQHLRLVLSITIIPYNNTYKKYLVGTFLSPTSINKPQAAS